MLFTVVYILLQNFFDLLHYVVHKCLHYWYGILHLEKKSVHNLVNGDINPILLMSATDLAKNIKEKNLSAVEVTRVFIEQIKKTNVFLNAVCSERFEEALKEAADDDELIRRCEDLASLPEFLGVPTVAKECHEVEGLSYSIGLVGRKDRKGLNTATCVQRMRDAGFIILGVTNVSEGCMWWESYNYLHGTTNNPFDLSRTPGGSSGGCGALMGACAIPVAITSDVAGSTRIPAYFNGIFGHKPTGGALPNTGTDPKPSGLIYRFCQFGPTTRHAKDLMPLLKIMAGSDGYDPECYNIKFGDPRAITLKGMKVYSVNEIGDGYFIFSKRHEKQQLAHEKVLKYLESQGCEVIRLKRGDIPHASMSFFIWSAMMQKETAEPFGTTLSEGLDKEIWPFFEAIKSLVGQSNHTLPALGLAVLDNIFACLPSFLVNNEKDLEKGKELKEKLKNIIGDGALIYPSIPFPAPLHYMSLHKFLDSTATSIFNITEFPATQIPLGLDDEGIPMGVQIIANHEQDHVSIGLAMRLEEAKIAEYQFPIDHAL